MSFGWFGALVYLCGAILWVTLLFAFWLCMAAVAFVWVMVILISGAYRRSIRDRHEPDRYPYSAYVKPGFQRLRVGVQSYNPSRKAGQSPGSVTATPPSYPRPTSVSAGTKAEPTSVSAGAKAKLDELAALVDKTPADQEIGTWELSMTRAEWAELEPKLRGMSAVRSIKTEPIKPEDGEDPAGASTRQAPTAPTYSPTERVGDADRDRAIEELHQHLLAGRLSTGEFEGRVNSVQNAATRGDLDAALVDLPSSPPVTSAGH
jgi:hypothetical protein